MALRREVVATADVEGEDEFTDRVAEFTEPCYREVELFAEGNEAEAWGVEDEIGAFEGGEGGAVRGFLAEIGQFGVAPIALAVEVDARGVVEGDVLCSCVGGGRGGVGVVREGERLGSGNAVFLAPEVDVVIDYVQLFGFKLFLVNGGDVTGAAEDEVALVLLLVGLLADKAFVMREDVRRERQEGRRGSEPGRPKFASEASSFSLPLSKYESSWYSSGTARTGAGTLWLPCSPSSSSTDPLAARLRA